MPTLTMITGGARSGKSTFALSLAMKYKHRVFLATAEAFDDEMRSRIQLHKDERSGLFTTIEEPLNLADALGKIKPVTDLVLIDCITVWLGNIMHHHAEDTENSPYVKSFLETVKNPPCDIIAVTNELGSGIVPGERLSRIFRDNAGRLNQSLAKLAQEVFLVVSGLPLKLKG